LMVCARLLEDPGRSVSQVAMLADFPSSTSLRNMLRRYTGLRPLEIRENGGLRCVLHAFKQAVEKAGLASASKAAQAG
jgi:methylphosphotriester-DNA--protein-cysteine methyltransferase